jgi:hypothetical protein
MGQIAMPVSGGGTTFLKGKYLYIGENNCQVKTLTPKITGSGKRNIFVIDVSEYNSLKITTTWNYFVYGQYAILSDDGTLIKGGPSDATGTGRTRTHDVSSASIVVFGLYTDATVTGGNITITLS